MNPVSKRLLFWSPRILGIAFAAFLSIFALDVFDERLVWWRTIVALLIHLAPALFVLAIVVAAWIREWIGFACYIPFSILYVIYFGRQHWDWALIIAGPPFVAGILFLVNWLKRSELHA